MELTHEQKKTKLEAASAGGIIALREKCNYFVSFNVRHYFPTGHAIIVQRPGEFLRVVRQILGQMGATH